MTNENEKNILQQANHRRLKYISVLPSFITILNAMAGFAAITMASKGFEDGVIKFKIPGLSFTNFGLAGLMIFIAMVADMLDGRVARMSNSTSDFGAQLDSLCDVVSFGIAPVFLAYKYLTYELTHFVQPPMLLEGFLLRFIWLCCAIYLACAVIRLARFNVENDEDDSSHMEFSGLPSPAAAGAVICLIVFIQDLYISPGIDSQLYHFSRLAVVYLLPFVVLGSGILMVSRITYPHVINKYLRGKKPLTHLIWAIVIISLIIWSLAAAMVASFIGFAILGAVRTLVMYVRCK